MTNEPEKKYMMLAVKEALKAKDRTYPNPMVGAVVTSRGRVVGKGYHRRAGGDHAEIRAIAASGSLCEGGTMFVTLEPCDHYGKTPPCTQAIIASGIRTVNIAMKDPNPINAGRGIRHLKKAGISVRVGLCSKEARELNRKYVKFITENLPYITIKLAQSLDGKIAARDGTSKWITSARTRKFVRRMRSSFNAIAVGVNTVIKDNPLLLGHGGEGSRYNPTRVIVDTRLRIPAGSNIIKTASAAAPVIIGTTELAGKKTVEKFKRFENVEVIVTRSKKARVSLRSFFAKLAEKGIVNVLVEGGGEFAGSLIDESLADEIMFFVAPSVIGGVCSSVRGKGARNITEALTLKNMCVKRFGEDLLIHGSLSY